MQDVENRRNDIVDLPGKLFSLDLLYFCCFIAQTRFPDQSLTLCRDWGSFIGFWLASHRGTAKSEGDQRDAKINPADAQCSDFGSDHGPQEIV
jgi:hypothetical protein